VRRLRNFDIPARLAPVMPSWVAEALVALGCLATAGVLRLAIDAFLPSTAPFSLLFPTVLVATLLAGWRCGAATLLINFLYAWYYILPPAGFALPNAQMGNNLIFVVVAGVMIIVAAQAFRSVVKSAMDEQSTQLEERDLLLRELDHRMRNNFQMVSALLALQQSRAADPAVKAALGDALSRVGSIADAHVSLYANRDAATVDMADYLNDICRNLAEGLMLGEVVRLECMACSAPMARDRAVAIGLIVNELVTNAVKYAFEEGEPGKIRVDFTRTDRGYELRVADDGKGLPPEPTPPARKGLGRGLVEAFARQAGGALRTVPGRGATFVLELAE
jgi:two-component sensor histidine kinase